MFKTFLTAGAAALALAPTARAEDAAPVSEVIVTAARLPATLADSPDAYVIDAREIEQRQAVFAADILSTVPGLSVSRNGAFGGITSVRMRGASADKTLVLIDGVPQNDASQPSGGYDFASLQLADIARVEVLTGPQGSLWGSDAIGGVIAFTTRETDGWRAGLEGGSFSTVNAVAEVGRSTADYALGATVTAFDSDGISKADGFPEKDGFRAWTATLNGRLKLSDAVSLDGRVRYSDSRADIDGYDPVTYAFGDTAEYATNKSWSGFGRATVEAGSLRHSLTVSAYDLDRASLGGSFPSRYSARRQDYRWLAEHGGVDDSFAYAFGAERDVARASLSTGDKADLSAGAVFGVARFRPLAPLTVTASLRYDDPDSFKGRSTVRIALVHDFGHGFSSRYSWGQGFKIPTISQVACDFCYPAGPSTSLRPERAEGWDAGLAWRSADGRIEAQVTGYVLKVRDQISYGIGRYVNLDRTQTTGVEASASLRLTPALTAKAAYAYTDAVDKGTALRLIRVPEHSGSASLLWDQGRFNGAFSLRAEGDQADSDPSTFSPAPRKGFVVMDLAGGWAVRDGIELTARIENLADRRYEEALGYGEPGRAIYVGVRVKG